MPSYYSQSDFERFRGMAEKNGLDRYGYLNSLNAIARLEGHSSWAMLHRHRKPNAALWQCDAHDKKELEDLVRSKEEVQQSLVLVPWRTCEQYHRPATVAVQQNPKVFSSALHALRFAISYMEAVLAVPRFHIRRNSRARWEMQFWLPFFIDLLGDTAGNRACLLVNGEFGPVGTTADCLEVGDPRLHQHLFFSTSKPILFLCGLGRRCFYEAHEGPWVSRRCAEHYLQALWTFYGFLLHYQQPVDEWPCPNSCGESEVSS